MRETVTALLTHAPGASPHTIASTGWLTLPSTAELAAFYEEYENRYASALAELMSWLGEPECTLDDTPNWFEAWYPEAFAAAVWTIEGKYLCLAAVHDDKETPVALVLRCLTPAEMEELEG